MSGKLEGAPSRARAGVAWAWPARLEWAPFACVYAAYGATFGVVGGGAPLVLRAHGASLSAIGLVQLITWPVGLAFLWAPLVDRAALPGLPHRLGWIGVGMIVAALLLLALAAGGGWPVPILFVLAMAVSLAMATTDIALEALVVESVPRSRRALVTTAKLVGSSLGTMVGVGLATAYPDSLGLPAALRLVAALDVALLVPLLFHAEPPRQARRASGPRDPERRRLLVRRAMRLGLFFGPAILLVTTPNLVLMDLKLSLPVVGFFTGTLTTVTGVTMTLAIGAAMTRFAAHRLVAVLAVGVAASALVLAVAVLLGSASLGFAAATMMLVFEGGLGVPVFTIVYDWSEGERAASDYALLFGVAFLVSFPARVLGPMLAGVIGWAPYFLAVTPVYGIAVAALLRAMREMAQERPT